MKRISIAVLVLAGIATTQAAPDGVTTPTAPPATNAPEAPATNATTSATASAKPVPAMSKSARTAAQLQTALDQLTQSNRDLLDLLKQQQTVLEDIQYDRRLESRQVQSLEERLAESQMQNAQLQDKVNNLEADAVSHNASRESSAPNNSAAQNVPQPETIPANVPPSAPTPAVTLQPEPTAPETYLPAPDSEGEPGTKSWHRLFTLKGTDNQPSQMFHVDGQTWRVLWHNQDKDGKMFQGTSALFIHAFPKDDTIPQEVCAKVGTGGDSTELQGPGNYYLKVEASGGSWELAVEDFR